ncbi:hypothetical protein T265_00047 [Opisthorchis viverrini]|uniref:Uncharacterized protein n=1 Tax=Opisthorchis viverrini TaxID=6198 RepID=A0A075ADG3_OPIVI|nr:hypothetical protein T265_00047 [Opisthorchis viverrini]KER34180.1 hypothetical protein T265_00047 [Opisthorchis viverrini]
MARRQHCSERSRSLLRSQSVHSASDADTLSTTNKANQTQTGSVLRHLNIQNIVVPSGEQHHKQEAQLGLRNTQPEVNKLIPFIGRVETSVLKHPDCQDTITLCSTEAGDVGSTRNNHSEPIMKDEV